MILFRLATTLQDLNDDADGLLETMHLSAHNWMRPEPLEASLQRLRRFGYSSIEIAGEPEKYPIEETRRLLQKYNISCWGTVTLMFGDRDLIAPDAEQRARSVLYVKSVVQLAADLGGSIVSVIPATVGKKDPTSTAENEWQWAVEGLREICSFAAAKGIRIGLEPQNRFETYFINRVNQTLSLAKEVGFDCGVAFDPFHLAIEEKDWYLALRSCGRLLVDFHVSENNRRAPGEGSFDWPRVMKELLDIGYDGALTVECMPKIDRTPINMPYSPDTPVREKSAEKGVDLVTLQHLNQHASGMLSEKYYTSLFEKSAKVLLPLIKDLA